MNLPKISLITPSFNQGDYIEQTILSVISQDYPNLEYIIIDGGSTDSTINIIKKYEKHISYWISEPDNGQTHAINKGIAKATGDIFYWLNSDDYLELGSLHTIAKEFKENDIDVLCVKNRYFENDTGKTVAISQAKFYDSPEKTIIESGMGAAIFYNLDKVKSLGNINESLHYAMDFDLWYKYLFAYGTSKIKYSNAQTIVHFRLHEKSKSVSLKEKFAIDTNAIHYSISSQVNAPSFLLDFYRNKPKNTKYNMTWNFSKLDPGLLLAYYANKISIEYYTTHNYTDCRKCLKFAFKNGYPANWHFIIRSLKVFLLPVIFLNSLRKMKNMFIK